MGPIESTVVELAGPDKAGKLAEVTRLLTNNGCNVRSAAVSHPSTHHGYAACVPRELLALQCRLSLCVVTETCWCHVARCGHIMAGWRSC